MNEQKHDQDEPESPRWVPYNPPPLEGWEWVKYWIRRLSFPFFLILFVAGLAGAYYWSTQGGLPVRGDQQISVQPSTVGEGQESDGSQSSGRAQVSFQSSPAGAAILVNGDSIGTTPLTNRTLTSGTYMVSVRAEGHFRADTVVAIEGGSSSILQFSLRTRPGMESQTAESSPAPEPTDQESASASPTTSPSPTTSAPPTSEPTPASQSPTYGALHVTSTPSGALVTVAGTERGRTPVSIDQVPLGEQQLAVALDGYTQWNSQVEVQADSTHEINVTLDPQTGRLRVLARPWGTIYVDGTLHARESDVWYETDVPAGGHRVTVVHPALGQRMQEVQVQAGEETSIVVDLQAQADSASSQ